MTHEGKKTYLGDGTFAEWDGYGFWLTAENGVTATDRIYLEPDVWRALLSFAVEVGADMPVYLRPRLPHEEAR